MTDIVEETMTAAPRIVLMACGSFSPPTPMHFRMFEIARDYLEMHCKHHVIGGIISPTHDAYGKVGLAPAAHRLAMLELGLKTSKWIRVSDWEIKQPQWSKTRTVLEYHQNYINNFVNSRLTEEINGNMQTWLPKDLCNKTGKVRLKLLCGADLLESFAVPGLWDPEDITSIVSNHGLVVISRYGSSAEKFIFESDILTKYERNITLITNWVPNEVSSSLIRRLLKRGQSVKYLLDDLILDYIQTHCLFDYKSSPSVFCCGDSGKPSGSGGTSSKNNLLTRNLPGQVIQVVASQLKNSVAADHIDNDDEINPKKKKKSAGAEYV